MDTNKYIRRYDVCAAGAEFALRFNTMQEVWEACERPDWLYFMADWNGNCDWTMTYWSRFRAEMCNWLDSDREKVEFCNHLRSLFPCPFND